MSKQRIPFRLYAQILIFFGLVFLGALILWPLQRALQGGMTGIRDNLITRLEQQVNRKIRYSSISPSIFGSFDVRDVRITGEDERPVLTISRFRIAYSLLDLLLGRPQGIHSVWIDTPLVDFDTIRDYDLISLFKDINTGENSSHWNFTGVFPEKFTARIHHGKCVIFNGKDKLEFDAPNLNIQTVDGRVIFDGRWTAGVAIHNPVGTPVSISVAMRVSGSFSTNMEEGEAVFSIPSITGDTFNSNPVAFGLVLEDNVVHMGKIPSQFPFDLFIEYGIDDGTIDAQLDCAGFSLGEFLSFSEGGIEGIRRLLDIAGSGTAFFKREADGSLGYSVDLAGSDGASFAIRFTGDEKRAAVDNLYFSLPAEGEGALFFGGIGFSGSIGLDSFAPAGILSLNNFSLTGAEGLNADIAVTSRNGEIGMSSKALNAGKVDLNNLSAWLRFSENDLNFSVSGLRGTKGSSAKAESVSLEGTINSDSQRIEARLSLDSFSAGDLAGMTMPFVKNVSVQPLLKGLLDGTFITSEIFFATDFTHLSYNAPRFVFTSKMGKGVEGVVSLSGTDRHFELNKSRLRWGDDILLLSGRADFSGLKDINFLANAHYHGQEYFIKGAALDGKSVNIQGSHGLNVSLAANNRGYTGAMSANGFPVPFLGHPAFLSFAAQLRYDTAASWSMNLENLELTNIASPVGLAQMRVSGSANQNGAVFPLLYYRDNVGPLSGRADISWPEDYSYFTGTVNMGEGIESYHGEGAFSGDYGDISFSASSMRLARVFGSKVNAFANGDINLSWGSSDRDEFRLEFNLPVVKGRLYDHEFGTSARAVLNSKELVVSDFNFSFAGLKGAVPQFIMNAVQGTVESRVEIAGLAGGRPVKGGLQFAADFTPVRSWFEIDKMLDSFSGTVRVEKMKYGSGAVSWLDGTQSFDIAFLRSNGAFSVSGGPRNMIRFQMEQNGNFYGGLSNPFPVRGTIIGSVNQKTINARCGDLYIDIAELFNLLPEDDDLYLTGGYVNASVDIKGSLIDPEFFGSARGTSLRIRIPEYVTQELRPIPFTVIIDGNEMRFDSVPTAVGRGSGTVSGWFFIDRWIPSVFNIDITVPRETPIPCGVDISGFTARGDTAGNLSISRDNLTLNVSGDLYATNTEMGIKSDELAASQGGSASSEGTPAIVNLTVTTGPVVEFFYPNSRFPILRANPDMGTKIHITADTLTQQYTLKSDVKIRGGDIFYFERRFYIRSGSLIFRENELNFEPRLTARAEIRDRTDNGPVTISMIVDNAPLSSFTARFESNPPLAQMEIFSLLGHTVIGTRFEENSSTLSRAFISSGSELLVNALIGQKIEQYIRNFARLDMFNVRTHILQNAFFMSGGMTNSPVDRTNRVGNYFDNTTVFVGKYIGQDMFVQSMLSMRYDENNTSLGGITFVPDIGIELQNPLFSIRWDFIPTHPENWYVNDNSITLTWSRSF